MWGKDNRQYYNIYDRYNYIFLKHVILSYIGN